MSEQHRLRYMVQGESEISDEELDDLETKVSFDDFYDYEYNGNFILSKDVNERDEAVCYMCCGIVTRDIELSNGEVIYLAFDYGH